MFDHVKEDIAIVFERDPAARTHWEVLTTYPGVHALLMHRLSHWLWKQHFYWMARFNSHMARWLTGIEIHPGATIGAHFFIDHGTGVVVGETCHIGNNVKLYHGVTLGARSFVKDDAGQIVKGGKRHPNVEDKVTIYPNSTILGGETVIGANSTIGANVFLMHSVPPNSLVVYEEKQLSIRSKGERKQETALDWSI